jgi:putative transposase
MVQDRRNLVAVGTFFFTVTLADRRDTTLVDRIVALREAFRVTRRPFTIDAIVVLQDHLHAVMTLPPDDADFSGRWRRIKAHFSHGVVRDGLPVPRNQRGEFALWQRRFWEHTVRDEADFARHVDYIHFNPVKHGYVTRVNDWRHSSFHRYVRGGILPVDWAGAASNQGTGEFGEPM